MEQPLLAASLERASDALSHAEGIAATHGQAQTGRWLSGLARQVDEALRELQGEDPDPGRGRGDGASVCTLFAPSA